MVCLVVMISVLLVSFHLRYDSNQKVVQLFLFFQSEFFRFNDIGVENSGVYVASKVVWIFLFLLTTHKEVGCCVVYDK